MPHPCGAEAEMASTVLAVVIAFLVGVGAGVWAHKHFTVKPTN